MSGPLVKAFARKPGPGVLHSVCLWQSNQQLLPFRWAPWHVTRLQCRPSLLFRSYHCGSLPKIRQKETAVSFEVGSEMFSHWAKCVAMNRHQKTCSSSERTQQDTQVIMWQHQVHHQPYHGKGDAKLTALPSVPDNYQSIQERKPRASLDHLTCSNGHWDKKQIQRVIFDTTLVTTSIL